MIASNVAAMREVLGGVCAPTALAPLAPAPSSSSRRPSPPPSFLVVVRPRLPSSCRRRIREEKRE
eukprot:3786880-Pyramimonas_sp.AAC.1